MPAFEERLKSATAEGPNRVIAGAVAIAADKTGKIRYHHTEGTTSVDPEEAKPISADNTFWIASCTKLMTTVAVMQCVERGLFSLDEDVTRILPEWKSPDIITEVDKETGEPIIAKATKKITLRQMLNHSSGMGYPFISEKLAAWCNWEKIDAQAVEGDILKAYQLPLLFEPGEGWSYSCSIDWAGKMVERVSGMRLKNYCEQNIWKPLGITRATWQLDQNADVSESLCPMTLREPSGKLVPTPLPRKPSPKDDLGGGGLYTSPNEYIKLLIAILRNDGTLLKPENIDHMFEPQLPDEKYLLDSICHPALKPMMSSGVVMSDAWNFGLGGILNMEDVDGIATKGTMTWGGLPNLFWWIDRTRGHCGFWAVQQLPPGDLPTIELALEFRRAMYKELAQL